MPSLLYVLDPWKSTCNAKTFSIVISVAIVILRCAHNMEEEELTLNDVFLHVHTENHDEKTLIDGRSARLHAEIERRREELTQLLHHQDEMQLYYDALGDCPKGSPLETHAKEAIIESHLGVHMDFRVSTSLGTTTTLEEQRPQTRMDLTDPLEQKNHDGDDWDIIEWMDEEHLGDES
ncbi:hypothetical protein Sjap_022073 [Stephania japonica]|uniref:Uncharacterized protein n=1 Tax=Stephania japonica TaxID=461633 RepID=A0AAP0EN70_9MAGN